MKIHVCDRCGKEIPDETKVFGALLRKTAWYELFGTFDYAVDNERESYDLCYDCYEQFECFMNGACVMHVDLSRKEDKTHE